MKDALIRASFADWYKKNRDDLQDGMLTPVEAAYQGFRGGWRKRARTVRAKRPAQLTFSKIAAEMENILGAYAGATTIPIEHVRMWWRQLRKTC